MENYWEDSPEGAFGKRETTKSKINCPGGEDFNGKRKGVLVLRYKVI